MVTAPSVHSTSTPMAITENIPGLPEQAKPHTGRNDSRPRRACLDVRNPRARIAVGFHLANSFGGIKMKNRGTPSQWVERNSIPEPNSGCWLWLGQPLRDGYGTVQWGGRAMQAHRFSWLALRGQIPSGQLVLHRCDNRICVNPDHLFLGTHLENAIDCMQKNRKPLGERVKGAKLTKADVISIRNSSLKVRELANQFRVAPSLIWRVRAKQSWRHVP